MQTYHHKPIKKFGIDGIIHDEATVPRLKDEYIRLLYSEMRIAGYAVRVDIDPDFTIRYNEEKEYFEFKLSLYGIYVGRKQSEWILGIDVNRPIYTPKNRSSEFSQEQV
jgi:hypothetical protein